MRLPRRWLPVGTRPHGLRARWLTAAGLVLLACAGPAVPSAIDGEPVCPNFTVGDTELPGALRYPILVRVYDGDRSIASALLKGRPDESKRTPVLIRDDTDEYQVHWIQCANPRSPDRDEKVKQSIDIQYSCGEKEGAFYYSEPLKTERGNIVHGMLKVPPPPNPECWGADLMTEDGEGGAGGAGGMGDGGAGDGGANGADGSGGAGAEGAGGQGASDDGAGVDDGGGAAPNDESPTLGTSPQGGTPPANPSPPATPPPATPPPAAPPPPATPPAAPPASPGDAPSP